MKFNAILMNPPYKKNTHLRIVEATIPNFLDVCLNLSPVRWLQDPFIMWKQGTAYRMFENTVLKYIKSLEVIKSTEANKYFDASVPMDLGIYVLDQTGGFDYESFVRNPIVDKVLSKNFKNLIDYIDYDKSDGWRCRLNKFRPFPSNMKESVAGNGMLYETTHPYFSWVYYNGFTKDGKHWSKNVHHKAGPKDYKDTDPLPMSIKFDSEIEANNFEQSTKTLFHRYFIFVTKIDQVFPLEFTPFLKDVVNPRTGKMGYLSDWTNDDFIKLYNISKEEQDLIEKTMKPYL